MSIANLAISEGATCSATGGTSKTFGTSGTPIKGGVQIIDKSVGDVRLRPFINIRVIPAKLNADGTWSFEKKIVTLGRPKIGADGKTQLFPSVEIHLNTSVENTVAESDELRAEGSQLLFDTDLVDFWRYGSLT